MRRFVQGDMTRNSILGLPNTVRVSIAFIGMICSTRLTHIKSILRRAIWLNICRNRLYIILGRIYNQTGLA